MHLFMTYVWIIWNMLSVKYKSSNWQCLTINTSQISFLVKTSFILVLESSVLIYWNYLSICECKRTLFLVDCLWKTNKSTFILIIGTLYLKIQIGGGVLKFYKKILLKRVLGVVNKLKGEPVIVFCCIL